MFRGQDLGPDCGIKLDSWYHRLAAVGFLSFHHLGQFKQKTKNKRK